MFGNYFVRRIVGVGVTGSIVALEDIPCKANEIRYYKRVTVENQNNDSSVFRLVLNRQGNSHNVAQLTATTANLVYTYDNEDVVLEDDDTLQFLVSSSTDNDRLVVDVYGYSTFED